MTNTLIGTFVQPNKRLIAIVPPKTVRQTSDKAQSCKVLAIDTTSASETLYQVEGPQGDTFWVPQHSIVALLEVTKTND